MNAGGERLTAVAGSAPGALPFQDLDWDLALAHAENLSRHPGGQGVLSFLDAGLLIGALIDPSRRTALSRHLVLPSGGFLSGLIFRALGARKPVRRFSPATFVPALLTYAERPLCVVVNDAGQGSAEGLCRRLAQHAPWHSVTTRPDNGSRPCDVLIVLGSGHVEARKTLPRANLVVLAGRHFQGDAR